MRNNPSLIAVCLIAAGLATSGCATVQNLIAANPQAAAGAAITVEARVGLGCVARTQAIATAVPPVAPVPPVSLIGQRQVRVQYERIFFDTTISPLLSETTKAGINQSRILTDSLCPPLPKPGLLTPIVEVPAVAVPEEVKEVETKAEVTPE